MTIKFHTDSDHETISEVSSTKSGERILQLDDSDLIALGARERLVDRLVDRLPTKQPSQGNINFLGSSFSGADVKVVAHLYDSIKFSDEKGEQLNQEKAIADKVVDACSSLISGGLDGLLQQEIEGNPLFFQDFSARRELFASAAGLNSLDPIDQKVVPIIETNILKVANFTFLGVALMKQAAIETKHTFEVMSTRLQQDIDNLKVISENSSATVTLGTLQTLSVSTFREKEAVRALGHSFVKGYTRGQRTIGGSMIFTLFNEHSLSYLIRALGNSNSYGERDRDLTFLLPDQLPPIDLTIVFANEYGALSDMKLFGVEFLSDSNVFSIEDLLSENVMNFICREAGMMTSRGMISISRNQRGMFNTNDDKDKAGSSLLFSNDEYNRFLDRLKVRRRLTNR